MYTETELVSFGNYLLNRYKVQVFSTDGINQAICQREVSHADMENWKDEVGKVDITEHTLYPSRYAIGAAVKVCLLPDGVESFPGIPCKVIAVHFTQTKVKYDLELDFAGGYSSRIYNVDSILVVDF